ncbi:MAG: ACT domain-containing protein [Bacillota bacterium]
MSQKKFLIIDTEILPDIYEKVLEAKELLRIGKVKGITEATQWVGISRSTFYKYKDYIFSPSDDSTGQKVIITFLLNHVPGVLSNLLNKLAYYGVNILTINQDIPIHDIANVSVTLDISGMVVTIDQLLEELKSLKGVAKVELIAIE